LLAAGTPLSDAFNSLSNATCLRHGERLAAAMRTVGCFLPDVVQPIAVAEESSALDFHAEGSRHARGRQVDERTSAFASLCEPVVIVILGALVGGLVIAMYLPIIQPGNAM
jgi:type IV pilus assembly protein PilC